MTSPSAARRSPVYDVTVVGGGIMGLAVSLALLRRDPGTRLLLLEKEQGWARHQTGRNSGVIHSGIYYKPGSLKARFCREGNDRMVAFCREQGIGYEICGKVIVATKPDELPLLDSLFQRGEANGIAVHRMGPAELREIEPHAQGLAALRVPSTGIVSYRQVAEAMVRLVSERDGELRLNAAVRNLVELPDGVTVETDRETFTSRFLVNCAGLHSDRIARMMGLTCGPAIVPFRGEYYELVPQRRYLVRHLIYPVPNPSFPFLGVHFTRMVDGAVHCGPNAVLALQREAYQKTTFGMRDCAEVLTNPAFLRLAARHWRQGVGELYRSLSKAAFVRSLRRLVPEVRGEDLVPSPAGVRAQALGPDGKLLDDFAMVTSRRSLHVLNAPSPAATASLVLGEALAERAPLRSRAAVLSPLSP